MIRINILDPSRIQGISQLEVLSGILLIYSLKGWSSRQRFEGRGSFPGADYNTQRFRAGGVLNLKLHTSSPDPDFPGIVPSWGASWSCTGWTLTRRENFV